RERRIDDSPEHRRVQLLEVLDPLRLERADCDDTGVVDEDVDTAGLRDQLVDLSLVAYVAAECADVGAAGSEERASAFEPFLVARADDDARAARRELVRDRESEAA